MVFASPLPAEFSSGQYYEGTGASFYLSPDKLGSDHSPVRYERELGLFHRHCGSGRVLDVGCGTGGFLDQLGRRFPGAYERVGTDIAGPALDHAEQLGIAVYRGGFPQSKLADGSFEAVTFWAVLEHLPTPAGFLREAARLLKPGGLCFALVPNFASLATRILGTRYRYVLPQHLNYFTAQTLTELFAGVPELTVVDTRWTHFNPVVIWQDWVRKGVAVSDEERARLLARTTALKQRRGIGAARFLYRGTEWGLGKLQLADNVVIVARRGGRAG